MATESLKIASTHGHPSAESIKQVFYQLINGRSDRVSLDIRRDSILLCHRHQEDQHIMTSCLKRRCVLMELLIQEYAKRLKLSWIRQNFDEIEATSNQEYLLKLMEAEVRQREERRTNLLFTQSLLPPLPSVEFKWDDIEYTQGLNREYFLNREFMENKENLIFYGGVGTGKTFLSTKIGLNAIQETGLNVRFYTIAGLVNKLMDLHERGTLGKFYKQLEGRFIDTG